MLFVKLNYVLHMILYFENELGGLREVNYKTQNFIVLDTKLRDACVGGLCETILRGWRSERGTVSNVSHVKVANYSFKWIDPHWVLE